MRKRAALGVLVAAVATGAPEAQAGRWPSPEVAAEVLAALPAGTVFVAFGPAADNTLWMARHVATSREALLSELARPEAYPQAIPSFVRVADVGTHPRGDGVDRKVAWELEVPLWNLAGSLWLKPFGTSVQLRMQEGAFAPGAFTWQHTPSLAPDASLLVLTGTANTAQANWATRRIAGRSPLAEPAMTAAAAYVLLEGMSALFTPRDTALGLSKAEGLPRWPQAPREPPPLHALPAHLAVVGPAFSGPVGLVVRRPNGRLAHVEVAFDTPLSPEAALAALAEPTRWRALPGWKNIRASTPVGIRDGGREGVRQRWEVDASFPFLDFDALWDVTAGKTLRAQAIAGSGTGAVWAFVARARAGGARVVFSLHPRLDRLGMVPRKFIDAEPLLEPGLALAVAYVYAMSLAYTLPGP